MDPKNETIQNEQETLEKELFTNSFTYSQEEPPAGQSDEGRYPALAVLLACVAGIWAYVTIYLLYGLF